MRVSVVVPAYNVASHLGKCIESVLAQTETSFELIVVNDGSTDDTGAVAERYAEVDSRVSVIHRPNGGLSVARNTGFEAATGDFLCFLDADDWAEDSMLASMVAVCEATSARVVVAGAVVDFESEQGRVYGSRRSVPEPRVVERGSALRDDVVSDEFVNLLGYAWNKLYDRRWLEAMGLKFAAGLSLIEDIEFNSRVMSAAERVVFSSGAYVHYVQRSSPSLGKARGTDFLALGFRAARCVDALLSAWGVSASGRRQRLGVSCATALWMGLSWSSESRHPVATLQGMLEVLGNEELMAACGSTPAGWRQRWAAATIRRGFLRVALLPCLARVWVRRLGLSLRAGKAR